MRKALFILGQLNDVDIEWIAHNGERRRLGDGEVIVREGVPLDALFITLDGQLSVTLRDGQEVARLGVGEVVGEIAFVDSTPPSATVTAVGNALVLSLAKTALQRRLTADPEFAARFYRALAIFLADRLRATTRRLGYGGRGHLHSDPVVEGENDINVLGHLSQARERFTPL